MTSYRNRFFHDPNLPFVEGRYTENSGRHYTPHRHDTLSVGAIDTGRVSFSSASETSLLLPGTLIVINPEVTHACNPIEGEARSYCMLYLDRQWSWELQRTLFGEVAGYVPVTQTLIDDASLVRLYREAMETLLDPEALYLEKEERLEAFALALFGRHRDTTTPAPRQVPAESHRAIDMAKTFMQTHYDRNIAVEQIAREAGLSRSYFIRTFRHATGLSPHAWLLNLRIDRAKALLATDLPIAQIALEVGFGDQSHLNRVFSRYVACTPHEYRVGLR